MIIYIDNHNFHYEIENICRLFFPNDKLKVVKDRKPNKTDNEFIYTSLNKELNKAVLTTIVKMRGESKQDFSEVYDDNEDFENECERQLAIILFKILNDFEKVDPPWGILTGIRPVKLMRKLVAEKGLNETLNYFNDVFLASKNKTYLCYETMKNEQKIINLSRPDSFSLYVSIPFCPTRCIYCSFVSQSIEKAHKLIPDYIELLCQEIVCTANIARDIGLKLETVYVGGGTPTVISNGEMKKLLSTIVDNFEMKSCREFTVEAGRPDTINEGILSVMKSFGVSRISINPQTMNDEVLSVIGRKHKAHEAIDTFNIARKCRFNDINMDLIAGLPEESVESFKNTLNIVCKLDPESITVHSLSMKKSSTLTGKNSKLKIDDAIRTSKMLEFASYDLKTHGYIPYYLYRQSRTVGNNENVGWAKPDHECLYNVYIMDETHTILACGAGAVSKLKKPNSEYLERIFNYKFPYEYISLFDEMIRRKGQVREFYEKF